MRQSACNFRLSYLSHLQALHCYIPKTVMEVNAAGVAKLARGTALISRPRGSEICLSLCATHSNWRPSSAGQRPAEGSVAPAKSFFLLPPYVSLAALLRSLAAASACSQSGRADSKEF